MKNQTGLWISKRSNMTRLFTFSFMVFLLIYQTGTFAQELLRTSGSAQMVLEDDMSKEELKEELRKAAKIDAIEREFGSLIEQESRIEISEGGSSFDVVGERYLKGEWLKTIHENLSEEYRKVKGKGRKDYEVRMSCELTGLIREITKPEIDFEFTPANCPEKVCRTTDFISGEPMYLFFTSPADGYMSVYTLEGSEAYRILPYQRMPADYSQHIPVTADTEYVFFSTDPKDNFFRDLSSAYVDELIMVTESDEEYLYLYVIFSTEEFVKPTLDHPYPKEEYGNITPRSLKKDEFESWLSENRIRSKKFYLFG